MPQNFSRDNLAIVLLVDLTDDVTAEWFYSDFKFAIAVRLTYDDRKVTEAELQDVPVTLGQKQFCRNQHHEKLKYGTTLNTTEKEGFASFDTIISGNLLGAIRFLATLF